MSRSAVRELLSEIERQGFRRVMAASIGFFVLGVITLSVVMPEPSPPFDKADVVLGLVVAGAVAITMAFTIGPVQIHRSFGRVTRWLEEARDPTPEELRSVLRYPLTAALMMVPYWVLGVVAFDVYIGRMYGLRQLVGVAVGAFVALCGAWMLAVLLVESVMGPLFGAVIGERPEWRTRFGLVSRLLFAWGISATVPLAALMVAPETIGLDPARWFVLVLGPTTNVLLMVLIARGFVRPLRAVEETLERVRDDDLDVSVVVDDGGEIGGLQHAVNEMVAGLRERRRIQELFGRHVGAEVARHAMAEEGTPEADVRDASVVFVDLVGSTGLAEAAAPDVVLGTLNRFFGAVLRVVRECGGHVNKFHGDGALLVFGVPGAQPDHAIRALRAARAVRAVIRDGELSDAGIDAGIGVSSGTIIAGNLGTLDRYEYTVIGDPVNEAARLCDRAKVSPKRVLASEGAILRSGPEAGAWTHRDDARLRGRSSATVIYQPKEDVSSRCGTGGSINPV